VNKRAVDQPAQNQRVTDPVAKADMCCRMSAFAKLLRYLRLL
jgi:hypothetical protein